MSARVMSKNNRGNVRSGKYQVGEMSARESVRCKVPVSVVNDKDTGNEYLVKVELNHDPCASRLINTLRMCTVQ